MQKHKSYSPADTYSIATSFARSLKAGDIVAFYGGLGAGKTAFIQGIAKALGFAGHVTSPTFALLNEYPTTPPIYHFDVYRLENVDTYECDWMDDYLFSEGICLIEWASNIENILPKSYIRVEIVKNTEIDDDFREIIIMEVGQ